MDKYTAEKLRTEFIVPLSEVLSDLNKAASDLEKQHKAEILARDYLPLNDGYAIKAIADLKRFMRFEVTPKLEAAIDGSLRFRDAELKFATKKKHK